MSAAEVFENTVGKGEITYNKQFLLFHSVFKRLLLRHVLQAILLFPQCFQMTFAVNM